MKFIFIQAASPVGLIQREYKKEKKNKKTKKNPQTDESKRRWQVNNRWSPQKIKSQARIFMITFILFNFMQINRP